MRDIGKRIAAEGYSVLVPNPFYRMAKAPVFDDVALQLPDRHGEASAADGVDQRARRVREGRHGVHRLARRAEASEQIQEDRHAGLLHGRPAGAEDLRRDAGSRRRGRILPWRRSRDRQARQPAPARAEIKAHMYFGIASTTTCASPTPRTSCERPLPRRRFRRRSKSISPSTAGACRTCRRCRRPDLQHGRGRTRLGQAGRSVQSRHRLIPPGFAGAPPLVCKGGFFAAQSQWHSHTWLCRDRAVRSL